MICVDTSVTLAELLAEDRRPAESFWNETLVSSRLFRIRGLDSRACPQACAESWRRRPSPRGPGALLELVSPVRTHALDPFPKPVRTLDALHLASTEFLRERQPAIRLATYDGRQAAAAKAMGIALYDFDAHAT